MLIKTYFESPKSYWLRWIGVLPIAFIAYVIISPIVKTAFDLSLYFSGGVIFGLEEYFKRYFVTFVAGFMSGQVYVITGVYIAPCYKKHTALLLIIIHSIIIALGMMTGYENSEYSPITENMAIILGMVLRYFLLKENKWVTSSD